MAFCGNCGSKVDDNTPYCPNCGEQIKKNNGVGGQIPIPNTPGMQQGMASGQQFGGQQGMPSGQQFGGQQGMPPGQQFGGQSGMSSEQQFVDQSGMQKNNKNNKNLVAIIGIIAGTIVLVSVIVVLFVFPGVLTKKENEEVVSTTVKDKSSASEKKEEKEESTDKSESESEEASSSSNTSSSETSSSSQSSSSAETAQTVTPPRGEALASTTAPTVGDFSWLSDFLISPDKTDLAKDSSELNGRWKGYIAGNVDNSVVYDGVERLFYVDMVDNAGVITMTITWYQFIGDGQVSVDSAPAQTYTDSTPDDGLLYLVGTYETIELGRPYYENGCERAVGVFTFSDGTRSYFAITRP